jgi:hypothetical protein
MTCPTINILTLISFEDIHDASDKTESLASPPTLEYNSTCSKHKYEQKKEEKKEVFTCTNVRVITRTMSGRQRILPFSLSQNLSIQTPTTAQQPTLS